MKRVIKILVTTILTASLILSGALNAFAADSGSIQVQYNGKALANVGTAKNVDGRIMVPFRQILQAMGADVTYDAKTKIISAKLSDRMISFSAGSKAITTTENGVTTTKQIDIAPFIDKNQSLTYVPVRFIAQSMGFCVGWDSAAKTVVIIDPKTLFSDADKDFSIISKLMKSDLDTEKAYASNGRFDLDITAGAQPGSILSGMDFSMSGSMEGVQQKANVDMVMNMAFQFDKMLSTLTPEEKAQIEPLLAMFKNASMKIKMDGETGVTYMNSSLFSTINPTVGANTWYKMNLYDTYADMGIDMKSMIDMNYSDVKLSELLAASLSTMEYAETSTYQDMKSTYAFMKNLMGDEAFAKKTAGSYTTYTLKLNQASVLAALAKTALTEGISKDAMDLTELGDQLKSSNLGADLMIKEKADSLSEYSLKGSFTLDEMSGSVDLKGDLRNSICKMSIDQKDLMKMTIDIEAHTTETSKIPDVSLPKDAVVVDYPTIY